MCREKYLDLIPHLPLLYHTRKQRDPDPGMLSAAGLVTRQHFISLNEAALAR